MSRVSMCSKSLTRAARYFLEPLAGQTTEHVEIPVHIQKRIVFEDEEKTDHLGRNTGEHVKVESPAIGGESPPNPFKPNEQANQVLKGMPKVEVTRPGMASIMSWEQMSSYSLEVILQLIIPQQMALHLGEHFPKFYLTLDENGSYAFSVADKNHPAIVRLIDSHRNQKSPGAQHPLFASLFGSL